MFNYKVRQSGFTILKPLHGTMEQRQLEDSCTQHKNTVNPCLFNCHSCHSLRLHQVHSITFLANDIFDVIYQTRGRVFHPISKHWEVVEKMRHSQVFFNQLQGVWISDETPFRMFDIASQTINNSWRKSKQKFTRFYDN